MAILIVNGRRIEAANEISLLTACHRAGIYIPSLCYHPDTRPFSACEASFSVYRAHQLVADEPGAAHPSHCGLCVVELEGEGGPVLACETTVCDGIHVKTDSESLRTIRRNNLSTLLTGHPWLCLACPLSEGCDRLNCSLGTPVDQRCCAKFNSCELRKVAHYVGINRDIPEYVPARIPKIAGGKLFEYDFNLCVGCLRCIRACQELQGAGVIGFVRKRQKALVGTLKRGLRESGCKFCGACVAVCPTGAMTPVSEKCGSKLSLTPLMMPPLGWLEFTQEAVDAVPEEEGVIQLFDSESNLIYIAGAPNMLKELLECLNNCDGARYFTFDKDAMYSQRQNELIQRYIDTHGKQPRINEELDDLF